MTFETINPATGKTINTYKLMTNDEIENILDDGHRTFLEWRKTTFSDRAKKMKQTAEYLSDNKQNLSALITEEMGKLPTESTAEIEKCALGCNYFAENAEKFLSPRPVKTDSSKSFVTYNPLGVILAIMPWNFPFWQVFRFAAPSLMAGNGAVLKHSPNTMGCALAIEKVFEASGFPKELFRTLIVGGEAIDGFIKHPKIAAVTLTGSVHTGSIVAKEAGAALKKVVLELGGSDPYIILEDADLNNAADLILKGRMQNSGQSCIAPKRILVMKPIMKRFQELMLENIGNYTIGEAKDGLKKIAPMARKDLREALHKQVMESVEKGAILLRGGVLPEGLGFYYPPTLLANVKKGMPAYEDELFGPVVSLIEVNNEEEAIQVANGTRFGLGAGIFTQNIDRGLKIASHDLEAGSCFVNGFVKSDPRLPFGGIKSSGFGRELSEEGIKEFVNVKTVVAN